MKDNRLYLIHIIECIGRIKSYTHGGKEVFLRDTMRQDAVLSATTGKVSGSRPDPTWFSWTWRTNKFFPTLPH